MTKRNSIFLSIVILLATVLHPGSRLMFCCTMFTVNTGKTILVAKNEDDITPFTEIRIINQFFFGC